MKGVMVRDEGRKGCRACILKGLAYCPLELGVFF